MPIASKLFDIKHLKISKIAKVFPLECFAIYGIVRGHHVYNVTYGAVFIGFDGCTSLGNSTRKILIDSKANLRPPVLAFLMNR